MTIPNTIGYVCAYCLNSYKADVTVCPECNDYDGMIPINKQILEMLEPVDEKEGN